MFNLLILLSALRSFTLLKEKRFAPNMDIGATHALVH
jgi:hypothetical protein